MKTFNWLPFLVAPLFIASPAAADVVHVLTDTPGEFRWEMVDFPLEQCPSPPSFPSQTVGYVASSYWTVLLFMGSSGSEDCNGGVLTPTLDLVAFHHEPGDVGTSDGPELALMFAESVNLNEFADGTWQGMQSASHSWGTDFFSVQLQWSHDPGSTEVLVNGTVSIRRKTRRAQPALTGNPVRRYREYHRFLPPHVPVIAAYPSKAVETPADVSAELIRQFLIADIDDAIRSESIRELTHIYAELHHGNRRRVQQAVDDLDQILGDIGRRD